jgi:hypothetical protein
MKKQLIQPALLALSVLFAGAGNHASAQARPNVLFVDIGATGYAMCIKAI